MASKRENVVTYFIPKELQDWYKNYAKKILKQPTSRLVAMAMIAFKEKLENADKVVE